MGAWGHGSFENDTALDWVSELTERRGFFVFKKAGGFSVLEKALEVVPDPPPPLMRMKAVKRWRRLK